MGADSDSKTADCRSPADATRSEADTDLHNADCRSLGDDGLDAGSDWQNAEYRCLVHTISVGSRFCSRADGAEHRNVAGGSDGNSSHDYDSPDEWELVGHF